MYGRDIYVWKRYPKPKNKLKSLKPSCILDMMIYTPNIFHTPLSNKQTNHLGSLSEKKTGLCGKNSQTADPQILVKSVYNGSVTGQSEPSLKPISKKMRQLLVSPHFSAFYPSINV